MNGVEMETKKHWNWNTALAGIVTAFILTEIAVGAYALACEYLRNHLMYDDVVSETAEGSADRNADLIKNGDAGEIVNKISTKSFMEGYPSLELLKQLYGFSFVLYRDLCVTSLANQGEEAFLPYQALYFEETPDFCPSDSADEGTKKYLMDQYDDWVKAGKNMIAGSLNSLRQNQFTEFNQSFDYWIWNKAAPELVITNSGVKSGDQIPAEAYVFLFQIDYDSHGMASISESNFAAADQDGLRRKLNAILLEDPTRLLGGEEVFDEMYSQLENSEGMEELKQAFDLIEEFLSER